MKCSEDVCKAIDTILKGECLYDNLEIMELSPTPAKTMEFVNRNLDTLKDCVIIPFIKENKDMIRKIIGGEAPGELKARGLEFARHEYMKYWEGIKDAIRGKLSMAPVPIENKEDFIIRDETFIDALFSEDNNPLSPIQDSDLFLKVIDSLVDVMNNLIETFKIDMSSIVSCWPREDIKFLSVLAAVSCVRFLTKYSLDIMESICIAAEEPKKAEEPAKVEEKAPADKVFSVDD